MGPSAGQPKSGLNPSGYWMPKGGHWDSPRAPLHASSTPLVPPSKSPEQPGPAWNATPGDPTPHNVALGSLHALPSGAGAGALPAPVHSKAGGIDLGFGHANQSRLRSRSLVDRRPGLAAPTKLVLPGADPQEESSKFGPAHMTASNRMVGSPSTDELKPRGSVAPWLHGSAAPSLPAAAPGTRQSAPAARGTVQFAAADPTIHLVDTRPGARDSYNSSARAPTEPTGVV